MKISTVIGGLVLIAAGVLYVALTAPENTGQAAAVQEKQSKLNEDGMTITESVSVIGSDAKNDDVNIEKRRIEMQTAFSSLEKSRKELKSRANLLKSKIWGRELPAEKAKMISYKMRQAYAYLKNPPMLGAYYGVNDIQSEHKKVRAMLDELAKVEQLIAVLPQNSKR